MSARMMPENTPKMIAKKRVAPIDRIQTTTTSQQSSPAVRIIPSETGSLSNEKKSKQ